eukprot:Em0006g1013a
MEPTDEESLAPDAKKRKVTFNTFKKWKTEMDKECQTLTWLDCDSELMVQLIKGMFNDDELFTVVLCDTNGEDELVHTTMTYFPVSRPSTVTAAGLFEELTKTLVELGVSNVTSITLGVLCTATGRANPTFSAMEDNQMQQLLSGFTELRKEVLRQQGEANCLLARRLRAGEALLLNRQKMIKLANRSELGWSVVEEYEADVLADNSEDEKITRAEKEAERKAIKRKKRFADGQSTEERQLQRSVHHSTPRLGPCFGCGEVGHIRKFCPKLVSVSEPAVVA